VLHSRKSTVITSEEQMLPILATEAEQRKTAVHPVTWLEAGLIPSDVLQRFLMRSTPTTLPWCSALPNNLALTAISPSKKWPTAWSLTWEF